MTMIEELLAAVTNNDRARVLQLLQTKQVTLSSQLQQKSSIRELSQFPIGTTALMVAARYAREGLVKDLTSYITTEAILLRDNDNNNVFNYLLSAQNILQDHAIFSMCADNLMALFLQHICGELIAKNDTNTITPQDIATAYQALDITDPNDTPILVRVAERGMRATLLYLLLLGIKDTKKHPTSSDANIAQDPLEAAIANNYFPVIKLLVTGAYVKDGNYDAQISSRQRQLPKLVQVHEAHFALACATPMTDAEAILFIYDNCIDKKKLDSNRLFSAILEILNRRYEEVDATGNTVFMARPVDQTTARALLQRWFTTNTFATGKGQTTQTKLTKEQANTIFFAAIAAGAFKSFIEYLLETHGCDRNASLNNVTPLVHAVLHNGVGVVNNLVASGDSLDALTSEMLAANNFSFRYRLDEEYVIMTGSLLAFAVLAQQNDLLKALLAIDLLKYPHLLRKQQLQQIISGQQTVQDILFEQGGATVQLLREQGLVTVTPVVTEAEPDSPIKRPGSRSSWRSTSPRQFLSFWGCMTAPADSTAPRTPDTAYFNSGSASPSRSPSPIKFIGSRTISSMPPAPLETDSAIDRNAASNSLRVRQNNILSLG